MKDAVVQQHRTVSIKSNKYNPRMFTNIYNPTIFKHTHTHTHTHTHNNTHPIRTHTQTHTHTHTHTHTPTKTYRGMYQGRRNAVEDLGQKLEDTDTKAHVSL